MKCPENCKNYQEWRYKDAMDEDHEWKKDTTMKIKCEGKELFAFSSMIRILCFVNMDIYEINYLCLLLEFLLRQKIRQFKYNI